MEGPAAGVGGNLEIKLRSPATETRSVTIPKGYALEVVPSTPANAESTEPGGKRRRKQNSKYSDDALGSVLGGGIEDFAPSPRDNGGASGGGAGGASSGGNKSKPKPKMASRTPSGGGKAKMSRPRSGSGGGGGGSSKRGVSRSPSGGASNERSEAEAHEDRMRQDPMSADNLTTSILELLQTNGPLTFDEIAEEVLVDTEGSNSPASSPRGGGSSGGGGGGGAATGNLAAHLYKKQLALLKQILDLLLVTPLVNILRQPGTKPGTEQKTDKYTWFDCREPLSVDEDPEPDMTKLARMLSKEKRLLASCRSRMELIQEELKRPAPQAHGMHNANPYASPLGAGSLRGGGRDAAASSAAAERASSSDRKSVV